MLDIKTLETLPWGGAGLPRPPNTARPIPEPGFKGFFVKHKIPQSFRLNKFLTLSLFTLCIEEVPILLNIPVNFPTATTDYFFWRCTFAGGYLYRLSTGRARKQSKQIFERSDHWLKIFLAKFCPSVIMHTFIYSPLFYLRFFYYFTCICFKLGKLLNFVRLA